MWRQPHQYPNENRICNDHLKSPHNQHNLCLNWVAYLNLILTTFYPSIYFIYEYILHKKYTHPIEFTNGRGENERKAGKTPQTR